MGSTPRKTTTAQREHHWGPGARTDALRTALFESSPARVLVAEDDDDLRRLVAAALRRRGLEVLEARSGTELLEIIGSMLLPGDPGPPLDLIITDVRMPGRSGLQILAGLRRADWCTPVIVITAFGDEWLHAEARRLGALAVLDKPFEIEALSDLAHDVIAA